MTARCPQCGSTLPPNRPPGVCPTCFMRLARRPTEAQPQGRFEPHAVEDLQGRIPGIELIELIGAGGMGAVYRGRQTDLNRQVAVKVLPDSLSRDPSFLERFRREAQALAKLDHPNIVTVFGSGISDGLGYIVMEFVEGTTLREAMQAEAIGPADALRIIPKICDALAYAHDCGIVHRDIKPENILLGAGGKIKVADFGLAKITAIDPDEDALTRTGARLGTFRYMAPEQVDGVHVDHRADIYSLGVVLYEMLTGQVPMGRFSMPSEKAGTDPRIDEVVMRTLCRDPKDRYQRVTDMESELESISKHPLDGNDAFWASPSRPGSLEPSTLSRQRRASGREWKSQSKIMGLPLVHIAYGNDPKTGEKLVAKGLIAIGDVAVGGIAVGGVTWGLVSFGGVAFGLNAVGGVAFALQIAAGGCAIGGVALGGAAVGILALGGAAVGAIAAGGGAAGYLAMGGGAAGRYVASRDGVWAPEDFADTLLAWNLCNPWIAIHGTFLAAAATAGPLLLIAAVASAGYSKSKTQIKTPRPVPRLAKSELTRAVVGAVIISIVLFASSCGAIVALHMTAVNVQTRTLQARELEARERAAAAQIGTAMEAVSPRPTER